MGLQGWDVGEGQAGALVGREEARTLEGGPPGSKPPERARSQVGIAVVPWLSPTKGLRPRGVGQSLGHRPCSPGSSSFSEKLLMPLKSRGHRVPRASPPLPFPPSQVTPK